MKPEIRRADISDVNLIAALGATTFYEAYFEQDDPKDIGDYIAASFSPAQIRIEMEDPGSIFLIAELDRKAVGYAKLREGVPHEAVSEKNAVELQRIYVLQTHRRRGIGVRLLEACLDKAREKSVRSIWLGVWEHNPQAQRFYEKHGFRKAGKLHFTYGDKTETNLVYEKSL